MSADPPTGRCEHCAAALAPDQRYCLSCGERVGSRAPGLERLLRKADSSTPADRSRPEEKRAAVRRAALVFPSPRVSVLLLCAFLGFGVILGNVASSSRQGSLASSAYRLVLPRAAQPSALPPAVSEPSTPPPASQPPGTSSTPTPTPAEEPTSEPAKTPSKSKNSPPSSNNKGSGKSTQPPSASTSKLPPVKHVFMIVLSNEPYASVFGPSSSAHYLSQTLEKRGELLVRYYAVAHEQLANEIALLSGQGPTEATAANCPSYTQITPATTGADEQLLGNGCVYPKTTQTLVGQLAAKHLTWRAYLEGIGEAATSSGACAHPTLGAADPTSVQPYSGSYATFRNPFSYFQATADPSTCASEEVGLGKLSGDLAQPKRTPNFSYIVPDRCHDGNPTPCTPGAPAGIADAEGFLKKVVPEVLRSKAYKENGLLMITVDEAPTSGEFADSSSCCGEPRFPNLPASVTGTIKTLPANGGGQVGALLLSNYVKAATTNQEPYNDFSALRTIEDLFGLGHLGYAAATGVISLEPAVFSAYTPV
ncbi:MAG TPA: alkaline phosphatase family protein [Solirubrobacteraceae bacterium]